jgi:uncharacterized membrane protein
MQVAVTSVLTEQEATARVGTRRRIVRSCGLVLAGWLVAASPAYADLRLCNKTDNTVSVAIGYKGDDGWRTEGWWNIEGAKCGTLLNGALSSRFYYFYAVDARNGGAWSGKAFMCTRRKMFTITGVEDCVARGYERTGFFEVDTGDQRNWTVHLYQPTEKETVTK